MRPHDLRHGYVSIGAVGGESLVVIGAIVGHSAAGMTERYAHLSDDPVRAAADRISSAIAAAMSGVDPAPVRKYPGRRAGEGPRKRRQRLRAGGRATGGKESKPPWALLRGAARASLKKAV